MRLAETVALGLLQGPAELLPVSSSAHVELLPWLLGWEHARLPGERRKEVEVALHAGTAVALAAAEWRAVLRRPVLGALATAPAAVAGLAFERAIESRLGTPRSIAGGLLAGSAAMVLADRAPQRRRAADAGRCDALWLGAAQAAALVPGVSRSAATRTAARARGFHRADAAELSREIALPVLAGATALKGARLIRARAPRETAATLAAGAAAAALSTGAALALERRLAPGAPLARWAAYRAAVAGAVLVAAGRRADRPVRDNRGR
jgi:undecaprenyl-diphosphatase